MIELSIIVPVYNIESYIGDCLESLAAQKYDSVEFILINDGSTDSGGDICNEYAKKDPRFCVIHKGNGGVSSTRNAGLEACRGQWIGFIDGDDWIEPGSIEYIMAKLHEHPQVDALCFGFYDHYTGGSALPASKLVENGVVSTDTAISNVLLEGGYFTSVWNKVFRREVLIGEDEILSFDLSLKIAEDEKFLIEALMRCKSCLFIPEPLYDYRYRENSALNANLITDARIDSLRIKRELADMLKANGSVYSVAQARMYNRTIPMIVGAYCGGDTDALSRIRGYLHGTWRYWLFAGDISLKRKAKVIAVCTLIRLHAPKKVVQRVMDTHTK